MSDMKEALRETLIAQPELIIDDPDVMRALVSANEDRMGGNVFDMRGLAMDRLERRIDHLENAHRTIVATAYDNQASTGQIHRAVLCLLAADTLADFVTVLGGEISAILRVDAVQLILETSEAQPDIQPHQDGLIHADPGVVGTYLTGQTDHPSRQITLRQIPEGDRRVYGAGAANLRSEACLLLEFGTGHPPGLLLMGSENPQKFTAQMGTDLLAFLAQVIELCLRRLI